MARFEVFISGQAVSRAWFAAASQPERDAAQGRCSCGFPNPGITPGGVALAAGLGDRLIEELDADLRLRTSTRHDSEVRVAMMPPDRGDSPTIERVGLAHVESRMVVHLDGSIARPPDGSRG